MSIYGILNEIEQAYPEDIFPRLTVAEIVDMTNNRRGIIDRVSASMGRHLAKTIREKLSKEDEDFLEWWDLNRLAFFQDDNMGIREIAAKAWQAGQAASGAGDGSLDKTAQMLINFYDRYGANEFQRHFGTKDLGADEFVKFLREFLRVGEASSPPDIGS